MGALCTASQGRAGAQACSSIILTGSAAEEWQLHPGSAHSSVERPSTKQECVNVADWDCKSKHMPAKI